MAVSVTRHIAFITISLAITIANVCVFDVSLVEAGTDGFSVELIHRDSPKSPLYNPSRSINYFKRANTPNAAQPELPLEAGGSQYLIQISIGTPPVKRWGFLDTGRSLIWTQCKPCTACDNQDDPLFDPKASSTYKVVPTHSPQCDSVGGTDGNNGTCRYSEVYDVATSTTGILSLDTITLNSTRGPVSLRNAIFGCGDQNRGNQFVSKSSGRIGFGNGDNSLIAQLGPAAAGKFSYCLPSDSKSSSKINFGTEAVLKGPGVVSTPLVPDDSSHYYYLTIDAISINNDRLTYTGLGDNGLGNIVIDTKTSFTILPLHVSRAVVEKVTQAIHLPRTSNGTDLSEQLCFKTKSDIVDPPVFTIHFKGGADVKLSYSNTFFRQSEDEVCLAFSDTEAFAVYGNYQQTNFLIGYDLKAQTLSFKPTDCTK